MADASNPIESKCSFLLLRMSAVISLSLSLNFQLLGLLCFLFAIIPSGIVASAQEANNTTDSVSKGRYILHASNCISCHTDFKNSGPLLGGGRAIVTEFGTFFSPNITLDPTYGIGKWTFQDFELAVTQGMSPQGYHYYPVFPYTSYAGITKADLQNLWSYLQSVPRSTMMNRRHQIRFPFSFRPALFFWKKLFFTPTKFQSNPEKSQDWNRGFYLVATLGHCRECHTPRNLFGALKIKDAYSGAKSKTTDEKIPNITPDPESGIGTWNNEDITWFIETGFLPDGDVAGSTMSEVIEQSTSFLTRSDRNSIAIFLKSLAPVHNPSFTKHSNMGSTDENW